MLKKYNSPERCMVITDKPNERRVDGQVNADAWAVFRAVVWIGLILSVMTGVEEQALGYERPVLIRFEGDITPAREQYLTRKIELAKRYEADLLIIEIDSPGGYVEESVRIAETLQAIDWAKTVAFIPREAISGAAFIALGCDEIVMAPDARIGDAGAIFLGEDAAFRYAPAKIRSYLVGVIRGLCEAKGRPPAIGEAMVDDSAVVWQVRNRDTGDETFLSKADLDSQEDPGLWEKVVLVQESREELFLMLSGERAIELNLAEGMAADREALAARYELVTAPRVLKPTFIDSTIAILNWWLVSVLLIAIGLLALYLELSAPGISVGGIVAVLCFALFFWSRFLGGTAGWLEVILFAVGVGCIALEIFVIPGLGVSGVLGLILIVASIIFASQSFWVPNSWRELSVVSNALLMLLGASVLFTLGAVLITRHFGSLPMLNRLVLTPPPCEVEVDDVETDSKKLKEKGIDPARHAAYSVGDWGVAVSALRPAGKIEINDELIDVISDGDFINEGSQVAIIKITGNQVMVRRVNA